MALDVDGFKVLRAIADAPEAFPDLRAEVAKIGRTLVVKQLKAKGLVLAGLRGVRRSLGGETFALVVDGLTEAEARSLITRLDKLHSETKAATPDWLRRHLVALADGTEPVAKSTEPKATKAKAPAKAPKVTRALGSAAFAATWDGKDHDLPPPVAKPRRKKAE